MPQTRETFQLEPPSRETLLILYPYLDVFLHADSYIGTIGNSLSPAQAIRTTRWQNKFERLTNEAEMQVTDDYHTSSSTHFPYSTKGMVAGFATRIHSSEYFSDDTSVSDVQAMSKILFLLGYTVHNGTLLCQFLPDISRLMKIHGHVHDAVDIEPVLIQAMGIGIREWSNFHQDFPITFPERPLAGGWIDEFVAGIDLTSLNPEELTQLKSRRPNLDAFREFIDSLETLDNLDQEE